jgi:ParB family chromosome partitioning protein
MPREKTSGNLALASYDDIFDTSAGTADGERIVQIPITELFPPEFHPFQVNDDLSMQRLAVSVKTEGVREPGIVRPRAEGGYELLCGNRRKRACEIAGLDTMPVIVRDLDDDRAAILMVNSNLEQREKLLPSERAWAYRVMMEALNHNGVKGEQHSYEIMISSAQA